MTHPLLSRLSIAVAAAVLAACGGASDDMSDDPMTVVAGQIETAEPAPSTTEKAVSLAAAARASRPIADRYIVTFKSTAAVPDLPAQASAMAGNGQVHFTYSRVLRGFTVSLPPAAAQALRNHPLVESVEQDVTVSTLQTVQPGATWGLDRIDQRLLPLTSSYSYATTAPGVTAFIIDTGVRASHSEFRSTSTGASRVQAGYTAIADGRGTDDCNGHGTHVAGTVGGLTWGVAKDVNIVPVRVLDCAGSGSSSGVIAGLDYVARSPLRPAVANMSLGGGASSAMDTAVRNAVAAGVTVVVAAGNSNVDACTASPAREPAAITVGATSSNDARASYSNFGTCLDLFAPGTSITSAGTASDTATATYSGTSMASPHTAGSAALVLASAPSLTPAQVQDRIKALATAGAVTSSGTNSPNLMLFSNPGNQSVQLTSVSLGGLTGSRTLSGNRWNATATITVKNASGSVVSGAVVAGRFVAGTASASGTCTTASNGICTLTLTRILNSVASVSFSVTNLSGASMSYNPAANAVATQITIVR
jgi:subtilisin family serine protease